MAPVSADAQARRNTIAHAISTILVAIGEDPSREGLVGTPERVAKFWDEFINYEDDNLDTTFTSLRADQMVVIRNIRGWSLCEHHLLPFSFVTSVGYIAEGHILGASKLVRIVQLHAHKLQVQERLVEQIASEVQTLAMTDDVAVHMVGQHTCMRMRGVRDDGAEMICQALRGRFLDRDKPEVRQEFMELIRR